MGRETFLMPEARYVRGRPCHVTLSADCSKVPRLACDTGSFEECTADHELKACVQHDCNLKDLERKDRTSVRSTNNLPAPYNSSS
jgi:hypothetical protein